MHFCPPGTVAVPTLISMPAPQFFSPNMRLTPKRRVGPMRSNDYDPYRGPRVEVSEGNSVQRVSVTSPRTCCMFHRRHSRR